MYLHLVCVCEVQVQLPRRHSVCGKQKWLGKGAENRDVAEAEILRGGCVAQATF